MLSIWLLFLLLLFILKYYNEIFILAQPRDPLSFLCSYLSQSLFVKTIDVKDGWKRLSKCICGRSKVA